MYRVIVHVSARGKPVTHEFTRRTKDEARRYAEEVTKTGFWVEDSQRPTFMPPSRIRLVEVMPGSATGR
jgi:hypothetical protein